MEEKKINIPTDTTQNVESNNIEKANADEKQLSAAELILQKIHGKKSEMTKKSSEKTPEKEIEIKEEPVKKEEVKIEPKLEVTEEKVEDEKVELKAEKVEESSTKEEPVKKEEKAEKEEKITEEDYSQYNQDELLAKIEDFINNKTVNQVKNLIYKIKTEVFKQIKAEKEEIRKKFIEDGSDIKDFDPKETENEQKLKELLNSFEEKKTAYYENIENEKKNNLKVKYEIIERIKELYAKQTLSGEIFNTFKDLQNQWNSTGLVPKDEAKSLWDDYQAEVKRFYDFVNINRELRELDYKKNLVEKTKLCEQAEKLLLETNISKAQKALQDLHRRWKEIGQVSNEKKDEIWERFKTTTTQINSKFQEYLEQVNEQQLKNLESKTFLCEEVEKYSKKDYSSHKEWKDASNQIIKIQKLWKGVGYVPKQHNTEIFQRFRAACDEFFGRIRDFYSKTNEERENNLQKKTDLCIQAESMQDSKEWRKTTEIYKNIQNEWKKIGPVPQRVSEEIWQRFRKACNTFFDNKKEYYSGRVKGENENLVNKKEIIEQIKSFEYSDKGEEDLKTLKDLQNKWSEIGFVPFENKDEIFKEYREALDEKFSGLNIDIEKQERLRISERIDNIKNQSNSESAINYEIDKLRKKIDELMNDIKVWENNLGFFKNSKNADSMLSSFTDKISKSREKVESYRKQIKLLQE